MKLLFAAASAFALSTLAILQQHHAISAVITKPDAKSGRGKKMRLSPVKEAAQKYGLMIYDEPLDVLADRLRAISPDLLIVAAYGAMIPGEILAIPRCGALNLHPSLLPKYRGASPIQAAILNGDKETGVTIIQLTDKLDAGPVIAQETIPIPENAEAGMLHEILAERGAELLQKTLEKIPPFEGIAQDESQASYTKKITTNDSELHSKEPAHLLERKIRAYNPSPGAYFIITNYQLLITNKPRSSNQQTLRLKIWRAEIKKGAKDNVSFAPNANLVIIDKLPALVCGDGHALVFTEVQPEGRKRMSGEEFVRGYIRE